MICPNCGEENSQDFRFCGMCGTSLEARRPAGEPKVAATHEAPHTESGVAATPRSSLSERTASQREANFQPSAGPSFLGLDQPTTPPKYEPTIDAVRERSFSGLNSFLEPEKPRTSRRSVLVLLALLAALGAAGWWTYTNYLGATTHSQAPTANPNPPADATTTAAPQTDKAPELAAPASSSPAPAAATSSEQTPEHTQSAPPAPHAEDGHPGAAPVEAAVKSVPEAKSPRPQKPTRASAPATHPLASPAPTAGDNGDAAFRRGEAYLYGRGVPENCDEAVKNLKAASAQRSAKARSTFGTMYATGHCVPRDLPTSYGWFALALRTDPNNQILEKDLTAIWNQMTPPERQAATKVNQ